METTIQISANGGELTEPISIKTLKDLSKKIGTGSLDEAVDDNGVILDATGKLELSGKQLIESPEMEAIAKEVFAKENLDVKPANVGYLLVYPHISKTTAARCIKNSRETKYYSGFDYLIEVSGEAWDHFDEKTRYMLIYHELLHIQPVFNEKKGDWIFRLRPHDFADFYEINDKHGCDWFKTVQSTISSLYDMNPSEEGGITA